MLTRQIHLLVAGLALGLVSTTTLADPNTPPSADPAKQPAATPTPTPDTAAPATPVNPKALHVPSDLPALNKNDLGDGLIAEDLKLGEGYTVKPGDSIVAHYHGMLKSDGTVFQSSYELGEPAAFSLGGVVMGWQKGVPGMKIGGIRRLTFPAKLGWGDQSPDPKIPANSDLSFIVEIVDAVQTEDVKVGDGEEVGAQAVCLTAYSIKTADGKDVDSATREHPFMWIPNEHMTISPGMKGMKVGGTRRFVIPAKLNIANPQLKGPHTDNVPVTAEIELLGVRNLAQAQPTGH